MFCCLFVAIIWLIIEWSVNFFAWLLVLRVWNRSLKLWVNWSLEISLILIRLYEWIIFFIFKFDKWWIRVSSKAWFWQFRCRPHILHLRLLNLSLEEIIFFLWFKQKILQFIIFSIQPFDLILQSGYFFKIMCLTFLLTEL